MRLPLLLAALSLPGCILQSEFCGQGFVEADGRCVPAEAPPPWYTDGGRVPDLGQPDFSVGTQDGSVPTPPKPDVGLVPPPDRWSDRKALLVVDRGDRASARRSPATPGFDLDAVSLFAPNGDSLGVLSDVLDAQINDPFRANIATNPVAALRPPDADGLDSRFPGGRPSVFRYVSLGTEGGYLFAALDLMRPLQAGDRLIAHEVRGDTDDEQVELYLCYDGPLSLDRCLSVGISHGDNELVLQP